MNAVRLVATGIVVGLEEREVLRGFGLKIPTEAQLALLGANGPGKTTLLCIVADAHRSSAGQILLDEDPVRFDRARLREHRRRMRLVLQDPDDQLFSADMRQDASFDPLNLRLSKTEAAEATDLAVSAMGIEHLADRSTHQLSYGERGRVVITGALTMNVDVLLLDEPTAGLDPARVETLLQASGEINAWGTTLVFSTHEVDNALAFAAHAAVMTEGRLRQSELVELLSDAELLMAARLRQPILLQLPVALEWETPATSVEQVKQRWPIGWNKPVAGFTGHRDLRQHGPKYELEKISQGVVVLVRKAKRCSSTSSGLPRKTTRFKVLRGEATSETIQGGVETGLRQVDECPGGYLINPMWLPGHLLGEAGGPETRMPSAIEN